MTGNCVLKVVLNKSFAIMYKYLSVVILFFMGACRPDAPIFVPLPTSVEVQVLHHDVPMRYLPVYFQYNNEEFPTYDDPDTWMDTFLITNAQGRIRLDAVPEGQHWMVATGYDSVPIPHMVYGSLPFTIDLTTKPKLDTVIYVSE